MRPNLVVVAEPIDCALPRIEYRHEAMRIEPVRNRKPSCTGASMDLLISGSFVRVQHPEPINKGPFQQRAFAMHTVAHTIGD